MERRIETKTSKTAQWTCVSRAASSLESDKLYQSNDTLALQLLPNLLQTLLRISYFRKLYRTVFSPKGIYEYVIARTKYIDTVFEQALADNFEQIIIFGAGFDTRSFRFQDQSKGTTIFELDIPRTQDAKISQLQRRNIPVPSNLVFVAIDFERETLVDKLAEAGFGKNKKSLFILEGLLMYLNPEAVDETLAVIRQYAGPQSRIVFDYLHASVLRQENLLYGEKEIYQRVARAAEQWHSAIDPRTIKKFLASHGFRLLDHKNANELEKLYFKSPDGKIKARINGTHCLVTAETA